MDANEFRDLLKRYRAGQTSPEESAKLEAWHMHFVAPVADEELTEQDLILAKANVLRRLQGEEGKRTLKLWPKIVAVAAAVTAVVLCVYFFSRKYEALKPVQSDVVVNDIAPGKNGATITLANGKIIQLSDTKNGVVVGKELKYDDGSEVQGADGGAQMLTAGTAKGQTYQFTLADGTKVWLNADSKISFPSQFNGAERKILLSGEGYFEVAKVDRLQGGKRERMPFIVKTENQQVTVLGTHFNISGYSGDLVTTTTLVEGSVRVSAFDQYSGGSSVVLKPNEQSIQNPRGGMQVRELDVAEALDWKNGDFIFREEPLAEILKSVGRWYNVDVIYAEDVDQMQTFSGSVSRSKPVSAILGIMQSTHQVKFRIEGRRVYVSK